MQHNMKNKRYERWSWCVLSLSSVADEEEVRPEEEAAGDVCRGGGARHGRPDEGVVPAAGATDLPHRLRWDAPPAHRSQSSGHQRVSTSTVEHCRSCDHNQPTNQCPVRSQRQLQAWSGCPITCQAFLKAPSLFQTISLEGLPQWFCATNHLACRVNWAINNVHEAASIERE